MSPIRLNRSCECQRLEINERELVTDPQFTLVNLVMQILDLKAAFSWTECMSGIEHIGQKTSLSTDADLGGEGEYRPRW